MNALRIGVCLGLFLLLTSITDVSAADTHWKAGVAETKITPEQPMWMAGYASRNKPSEGVAQDLFAKALALEDSGGNRLIIVTLDLIGVPRALRKNLEKRTAEVLGLKPESLLINASHTHCGPELRVGRAPADKESASGNYAGALEDKLFTLVGQAWSNRAPANLAYSHARAGFGMNRRLPSPTGYRNSPNPEGPVDTDVPVLMVKGADNKFRAVLFGYACHNTTLSFYQFCGDYAGFAQEYLQKDNPGVIALFMLGCGGDQNPYPRGTIDLAQKHGRTLATAVESAISVSQPRVINGPLRMAYTEIELPYDTHPTKAEFEARLQSKDKYEASHAQRMLDRLAKGESLAKSYPYPIQVVRFGGELVLVALGGEVVVDFSLRLKWDLAGPAVWVAGYSNDVMAYIPSRRVWTEGGYEAGGAMRFSSSHPTRWAGSVEELIVKQVHELAQRLQR
ncbi:MAG: neutral/alkaline non-lysosomal ceramidase N-terminal domain-containing protein [Verrucomicrobiota bacterium]